MDALIKRFDAVDDGDLMLCARRGLAYQKDMKFQIAAGVNAEGNNYFDHYAAMDGSAVARAIHDARVKLVDTYVGPVCPVLDVGIGSGEFIRRRPNTFGTDVNPLALAWLDQEGRRGGNTSDYQAFTFWDVLEHIDQPDRHYFRHMPQGSFLFTSLPIFRDLKRVRESKHYKPGEHLYYWTEDGFIRWMADYRFRLLERNEAESAAGRESIVSFAFKRDLPDYHATLDQYRKLHAQAYGTSAWLYFQQIAKEVLNLNPSSILDYGCGRSDLVAHFWKDGQRRIAKYDPAIPQFEQMPGGEFDLVICCDVMEHIPLADIDRVLAEIRAKGPRAIFTISMKPARAHLPDGRNAHVTLLNSGEWTRWIKSAFKTVSRLDSHDDQILTLRTW